MFGFLPVVPQCLDVSDGNLMKQSFQAVTAQYKILSQNILQYINSIYRYGEYKTGFC